ncbi:MAG: caspase family protein, partial [Phycisphaeraceae bacterium]|nr:caspase family protein [Phycisphaeraceae bacterium]
MRKRALLIGNDQYHLLSHLRYARQDAESFAEALCSCCGFTDQEVTVMSCGSSGGLLGLSRYIEHALARLADDRDLGLLVFGFWGHGFCPSPGRRYLCGIDTLEMDLERTAVSLDVVKAKLAQVQAQNTLLLLDCCQNKPGGRSAAADPMTDGEEAALSALARDIQVAQRRQSRVMIPTVAVLNACSEGQKAFEWESRGHGVFTAHLLDGLRQGLGGIASISAWAADRVTKTALELHGQAQTPYITIEGKGDIALTTPSPMSATVSVSPPPVARPPRKISPRVADVHWWVVSDGQERGPLDDAAVREGIRAGDITRQSECWRAGMDQWQAIATMPEWADAFP